MPKEYPRTRRVAEQIRRDLADLIQFEVKDPGVRFVTLTGLEVTPDYAHARVYYTTLAGFEAGAGIDSALKRASGFLRSQLGHRLKLRVIPELHFIYDTSVERGVHLAKLIDQAVGTTATAPPEQ